MAHIERNWGDSFPTGWVWAQASAPFGEAFLVLTGGRFVIGPITTDSHVIGLRTRGGGGGRGGRGGMRRRNRDDAQSLSWDFRTTDLDRSPKRVTSRALSLRLTVQLVGVGAFAAAALGAFYLNGSYTHIDPETNKTTTIGKSIG